MKSVWTQLILLSIYMALMFCVSRILDLVLWYQHGMPSTQIVDPLLLSVRQLKQLLENRGVSYTGYIEKKELAQLAEETAQIVENEVEELHSQQGSSSDHLGRERLPVPPAPSRFTGGAHFYEEVEDTKDSVWLVQVVPTGQKHYEPLLDDYSWRVVCNYVAPFAIRTGVFDCKLDRRLCSLKGWQYPLLLLALPKGTRAKDKVILKTFTATRPQTILEWLRDQLSIRVQTIKNIDDLQQNWLGDNRTAFNGTTSTLSTQEVKVLLLTHLIHPPLFLAALSVKFTARIKFGMLSVRKHDTESIKKLKNMNLKVPSYLIKTPEHTIVYGKRKLEHFNFDSMNKFLRAVHPEMNDVFLFSLIVVNLLVGLQFFQVSVHLWWKHVVCCLWTLVSYNFWLFVTWLVILATYRFSFVNYITDNCLVLVRFISLTEIGSLARTDWQMMLRYPYVLVITFFIYSLMSMWFLMSHCSEEQETTNESEQQWWEVLPVDSFWINCFFRPMATLSRPLPPTEVELEEGLEMLIERLAVPNLWLQPVISSEYIKDLPVWKYRGWENHGSESEVSNRKNKDCDSPETLQWLMDNDDFPKDYYKNKKFCKNCYRAKCKYGHVKSGSFCNKYKIQSKNNVELSECKETLNKSQYVNESCCDCKKVPNKGNGPKELALVANSHLTEHTHINCTCERIFPTSSSYSPNSDSIYLPDDSDCKDCSRSSEDSGDEGNRVPPGMLPTSECAVCLETYSWRSLLCGLPCGHSYHQSCIMLWLQRDNHHCPVCRWPAYKLKAS